MYRSAAMNKADPGEALQYVEPILREKFPYIDKFIGGNFYRHNSPYHPHVDHQLQWPLAVNFVIPIYSEGTPVHFVVFDQRWHNAPITWSMIHSVDSFARSKFSMNFAAPGAPGDYDIEGHTSKDIDVEFWKDYLPHPHDIYYGLSGEAFPFAPGSVIVFETKRIHCTGKIQLNKYKLGLTLRYSVKQ